MKVRGNLLLGLKVYRNKLQGLQSSRELYEIYPKKYYGYVL